MKYFKMEDRRAAHTLDEADSSVLEVLYSEQSL